MDDIENKENNENNIQLKSPIELTYEFLIERGCTLTYEEYLGLHKEGSNEINPLKIRYEHSSGMEWCCPVGICKKTIKKGSNPVHCVDPECIKNNDSHHYFKQRKFSYWCPICKIHSENPERCVNECTNCDIHGPECIKYKTDAINCDAENCIKLGDPHHHNPKKLNHKICSNCYYCHEKNLHYCDKCDKCYLNISPHCESLDCINNPHHLSETKISHKMCLQCLGCHEEGLTLCEICNKCFLKLHCGDKKCEDPHHETRLKEDCEVCDNIKCGMCHTKSSTFCEICNKCFPNYDTLVNVYLQPREHCRSSKCSKNKDPHHMSRERCTKLCIDYDGKVSHSIDCTSFYKYCELCEDCHQKAIVCK